MLLVLLLWLCWNLTSQGDRISAKLARSRCLDEVSCMNVHLNNAILNNLLVNRCNVSTSLGQHITFTHFPKTGGSTITAVLRKFAYARYVVRPHEPYFISAARDPNTMFITILRDPMSRAISLFNYINARRKLPPYAVNNRFWNTTFGLHPAAWSTHPYIQQTLYQEDLSFFIPNLKNLSDGVSTFSFLNHSRISMDILPSKELQEYLQYTDNIHVKRLQCREHLQVSLTLLKAFAAVGTLEKRDNLLEVIFHRVGIPDDAWSVASKIHMNPAMRKMSSENVTEVRENLKETLYCSMVLWRIADLINTRDLECIAG